MQIAKPIYHCLFVESLGNRTKKQFLQDLFEMIEYLKFIKSETRFQSGEFITSPDNNSIGSNGEKLFQPFGRLYFVNAFEL